MMYRRKGRKKWTSEVRTRTGWKQFHWGVRDRTLAGQLETMWRALADEHLAWDVLDRVLQKDLPVLALYSMWTDSGQSIHRLREKLNDADLAIHVPEYVGVYSKGDRATDTKAKVALYLGALCGPDKPLLQSNATADQLTQRLFAYKASPSTLRKVHSAWTGFFRYLVKVKKLFAVNPMDEVERPSKRRTNIQFYESETVEHIVAHQPTQSRRALFAMIYGTGMDVTPAVEILRSDINADTREVRCMGTKANTRDRIVRVADWAWEIFWPHARLIVGNARVFDGVTRWTASDWHRETVKTQKLSPKLPLRMARHHWAVRALRSGTPAQVVADQMGHARPHITLEIYGRFLTDSQARDHWEKQATAYDERRRKAGANG